MHHRADKTPSYYYLFLNLKSHLCTTRFRDDGELILWVKHKVLSIIKLHSYFKIATSQNVFINWSISIWLSNIITSGIMVITDFLIYHYVKYYAFSCHWPFTEIFWIPNHDPLLWFMIFSYNGQYSDTNMKKHSAVINVIIMNVLTPESNNYQSIEI